MDLFVEPKKVALIVIDMQADFYAPHGSNAKRGKQVSQMQLVATKLNQFVQELHDHIGLTVFTKYLSGKDITPENLRRVADKEGYNLLCKQGSGLEELYRIEVPDNAVVVEKTHYDAFAYNTKLLEVLKQRGITTVMVTGVRTEICVDATAKRAVSEGYDTVIVSDLVGTYNDKKQVHQDILSFFGKYYGFVLDSSVIKRELSI